MQLVTLLVNYFYVIYYNALSFCVIKYFSKKTKGETDMKLIVAEKPSLARNIVQGIGRIQKDEMKKKNKAYQMTVSQICRGASHIINKHTVPRSISYIDLLNNLYNNCNLIIRKSLA